MTAETAYNVIQALPKKEMPRLFKMLGVSISKQEDEKPIKKSLITDAEATEYLLRKLKKKR
ncbi:hypothetical protein R5N98_02855 [Tenacibaculum maritimum]|uniref:hypothetical protein n=1 Tax=Tenacibaculum maritimum TaxID=107401 RepID=UPI0012E4BD09|nr:hypothetical protein [Tenacibaculum maritimum]CAA0253469.1 conserved hypothetical protein [Tenacibaculum maritimum]